jgi:hypothetical protein
MLIRGIYLDTSVVIRKIKNSFEIVEKGKEDVTIRVLPVKDAILIKILQVLILH